MRRVIRILATVTVLVLATGVVLWRVAQAQQGTDPDADPNAEVLDSTTVERGDLTVTVSATGPVSAAREVDLAFEVAAPVTEVLVAEGQHVSTGDILARLDTTDLAQALEDAQVALEFQQVAYDSLIAPARDVDVAAAQSAVDAAEAGVAAASQGPDAEQVEIARLQSELSRNQLWQAQLQRDNTMEIGREFRSGDVGAQAQEIEMASGLTSAEYQVTISDTNYGAALSEGPDQGRLGQASAQLTQAQVGLDRLLDGATDLQLQQAEIDLQTAQLRVQQAQSALDKAVLIAPFDGVIAENNLVIGELPPATAVAILMLDASSFVVDLAIDETDIAKVQTGQSVEFRFDALEGEDIGGTVTRVGITPIPQQQQLVTYEVRVVLNETEAPLRVGMTSTATIIVTQLNDVLTVPNRFVRIDRVSGRAYVTIETDEGTYEEIPVELGLRNDTTSQVVNGLDEGQTIVLLPRETFNPLGG